MCTLQTALKQAKQYPIFPCGPDKVPLVKTGFKAASQAPAQITAWWREFPNALIGIPTGKASGMLVVDIDRKNGHDGLATLQANAWSIPLTRIQQTTSGGQHVFFQYPAGQSIRCSAGVLGDGIDIRAEGGYVICWEAEGLPRLCEDHRPRRLSGCKPPWPGLFRPAEKRRFQPAPAWKIQRKCGAPWRHSIPIWVIRSGCKSGWRYIMPPAAVLMDSRSGMAGAPRGRNINLA